MIGSLESFMKSNGLDIKRKIKKNGVFQVFQVKFKYMRLKPVVGEGATKDDALCDAWDKLGTQVNNCSDKELVSGFDRAIDTYIQDNTLRMNRRLEKAPLRVEERSRKRNRRLEEAPLRVEERSHKRRRL